jgi:cytoskeletal protein CcmA (bactofilin family)
MSKTYDDLKRAEEFRNSSTITSGIRIKGQVQVGGSENLVVNGAVEGPIRLEDGKLTVGEQGKVSGDASAALMEVSGSITGNVVAKDRLEIRASGSIIGDVTTPRIVIDDGAYYKGSIAIGAEATTTTSSQVAKGIASGKA